MEPILFSSVVLAILALGMLVMFAKFYRKIEQGHAMIVNTMRAEPTVTFTGCMVYPIIHKAELMDISVKTIEIDRSGNEGLICRDNIRADIKVKFFVRVNKTAEDVLKVAQGIGCLRASNHEILEDLFSAKFSEALKTVGKSMDFVDLYQARDNFRDEIIRQIGDDLSGYVLEDAAIDYLEQTPLSKLDAHNILDAQGIKKITELTAVENVRTNELRRNEEMQIKKKNVETQEALLELERQQADAQARQSREVATSRAREEAETAKIQAEERAKAELAKLQTEQLLAVQQENSQREKEVAENNRKRAVAIEEEKVTRARQLEVVDREKEVALQQIDKERAVEVQKKAIADVIRERIVVERTVAEQEEAIKEVRIVAEAERTKKSVVILAEGHAEEKLLTQVKEAEAQERRARHKATEEVTLAEARLKVAEKVAESKKREAEATEALSAAPGLAAAKVMTVTAEATQKQGLADAQVISAKAQAEAQGMHAKMAAEAQGREKLGLANVAIRTAEADATVKAGHADAETIQAKGRADAETIQARFSAEAKGLHEKFEAMKAMGKDTREHEEFRMRLEKAHIENLRALDVQNQVAGKQAEVLGTALRTAKIEMVGGDGAYFEKFVNAIAVGKGLDGAIGRSQTLQVALKDHLSGERNMVDDAQKLLAALGASAGEAKDLSIASLLSKAGKDGRKSAE